MKLLEVLNPEIDIYVRYKVIDSGDVDTFVNTHKNLSKDEYTKAVLETIVFNLRSEVSDVLRSLEKDDARRILDSIYNGCVMLNPGLDVDGWLSMAGASTEVNAPSKTGSPDDEFPPPAPDPDDKPEPKKKGKKAKSRKVTKAKFLGMETHLKKNVIGQDEAIESITGALKRSITGLGDDQRPMGVFLFAGASGVGKSYLAKELHSYLYGDDIDLVRIDCGEFQHKHENQKLIGSPPGYIGHDEGGYLTNQMKKNPHTVVLLDEVEKAHPDLWNTFLRVFDEGMLTDSAGKTVSFRESIIIMTTNLGNREAIETMVDSGVGFGGSVDVDYRNSDTPPRAILERHTTKKIQDNFKPEFLNRIDKVVVFNHLEDEDLKHIAELELSKLQAKLRKRGMTLNYTDDVTTKMVEQGVDSVEGARGLARIRREVVEDKVSDALLKYSRWPRGTVVTISWDEEFCVETKRPTKKKATSEKS